MTDFETVKAFNPDVLFPCPYWWRPGAWSRQLDLDIWLSGPALVAGNWEADG